MNDILQEIQTVQQNAKQLYSEQQIEQAIRRMAGDINLLLYDRNPIVLSVMNGALVIAGTLLPRLQFPLTVNAIQLGRYGNDTHGGDIQWTLQPVTPLRDRTVLIVDDILDQGITLQAIIDYCQAQEARSIYSAVLIDKILNRDKPVKADFVALQAPDRYLFGYGMDYKGYLRNLPGIYAARTI